MIVTLTGAGARSTALANAAAHASRSGIRTLAACRALLAAGASSALAGESTCAMSSGRSLAAMVSPSAVRAAVRIELSGLFSRSDQRRRGFDPSLADRLNQDGQCLGVCFG